jgi:hypothetical protein
VIKNIYLGGKGKGFNFFGEKKIGREKSNLIMLKLPFYVLLQ